MDTTTGALAIVGVCGIVLLIVLSRQRTAMVLHFLARSMFGIVGIYMINMLFAKMGMEIGVGINPISILTVGSLGTGGLGLLYGILLYNLL